MSKEANTSRHSARRDRDQRVYTQRIMGSLVASLAIVIVVAHLPVGQNSGRIGWLNQSSNLTTPLELIQPVLAAMDGHADAAPVTDFGLRDEVIQEVERDNRSGDDEEVPEPLQLTAESRRIDTHRILNFADQQPEIVGGLAGYYLNIEYPEEAREAGIQGRLLLSFVVERDGRATDIRVEHGLHPLCDSAAVQALRRSRFIAGRQNGEIVRVRMRLPVRFMLLDEVTPPAVATTSDGHNGAP